MLAIRLTRTGKIHSPHYRIVVQEKRSKLNGKAIDTIGHYHPAQAGKELVIDKAKAEQWIAKGAQTSDTVTNLFVKEGIFDKSRKISHHYEPKAKADVPVKEVEVAAETPVAEEAVETPTEVVAEATEDAAEPAEPTEEVAPEATEAPAEEPAAEANEPAETA